MRKLSIFLLFIVTSLTLCLAVACGKSVTLKDFENETSTAELQDIYNVPVITQVKDNDGNVYPVEVNVYDSKRKSVLVSGFQFIVEDIGGYSIEYTANVNNKQYVKKISVSVTNTLKPIVNFNGETANVDAGQKIEFATATAYSATGTPITVDYTLYDVSDGGQNEISISQSLTAGTYLYKASATDVDGRTSYKTQTFYVFRNAEAGEVEYFDTSSQIEKMSSRTVSASWVENFEGRQGVAKFTWSVNEQHSWVFLYPRQDKSAYSSDTHIVLSMYIDDPSNAMMHMNFTDNAYSGATQVDGLMRFYPVRGEWHEYVLPIDMFLNRFDYFATAKEQLGAQVSTDIISARRVKTGGDIVIYIDKIYTTVLPDIEFNDGAVISSINVGETVKKFPTAFASDKTGVLPVTYKLIRIAGGTETEIPYTNGMTFNEGGNYSFRAYATSSKGVERYIEIPFSVIAQPEQGEVQYFSYADSVNYNGANMSGRPAYTTVEWLSTYNGKDGVAKMETTSMFDWWSFLFFPRQEKSAYEDYTHIVFTMYVDDAEKNIDRFCYTGYTGYTTFEPVYGEWHDYVLPIDTFLEHFDEFYDVNSNARIPIVRNKSGANATIYIDSIRVINAIEITFDSTIKNAVQNTAITLPTATATLKNGSLQDVVYTVKKPDGTTQSVTANTQFTPTVIGKYEYIATVTSTDGLSTAEKTMTFEVTSAPDKNEINNYTFASLTKADGLDMSARPSYIVSEWLETYEGRDGVAKIDTTKQLDWWGFYLAPRQEKSAYEGYTHIVISMYVDDSDETIDFFAYTIFGGYTTFKPVVGEWHEYELPIDVFLDHYDDFVNAPSTNGNARIALKRAKSGANATLYIDGIYCITKE